MKSCASREIIAPNTCKSSPLRWKRRRISAVVDHASAVEHTLDNISRDLKKVLLKVTFLLFKKQIESLQLKVVMKERE